MIKQYFHKVSAVAYDEKNSERIRQWLGKKIDVREHYRYPYDEKYLTLTLRNRFCGALEPYYKVVYKGDYIVKLRTGELKVYSPDMFPLIFKEKEE